jgi:eukaryotic-like serine/threonine-protein kinase
MARVRGAAPIVVGLVAAGLLVGLLGFSSTLNPIDVVLGRGAIVTVPDLEGRPQPGAEADVRAADLVPRVTTSFSLTGARGTVISQDPAPGSRVREGTKVKIVVSRGINRVAMPDAVGKPYAEVIKPLDDAGVELDVKRTASESVAKDLVVSQDPGPGVLVTGDDTVHLVVSTGPAPRPVPTVAGLALSGASFDLGKAGLAIGPVTQTDDATAIVGSVLRTDPVAGTVVARDTPVGIAQAAGPAPVALPNLVGVAPDAASATLTGIGFVPNVIYRGAGTGPVTTQDPPAAAVVRPGTVVTLSVGG